MARNQGVVGIDISKDKADCEIYPSGQRLSIGNDESGLVAMTAWLRKERIRKVVVEATGGYEKYLVRGLRRARYRVDVVDPKRIRSFAKALGIRAKTDKIDAGVIARFGAQIDTPEQLHDPSLEPLVEHHTYRRQLVEEKARIQNQLSKLSEPDLLRLGKERLGQVISQIGALDQRMAQLVAENEALQAKADLIRSMPCAGPVLTCTLLALMPELGLVSNPRIAALAGVAPFDDKSGKFVGKSVISGGRVEVRNVLYMVVLSAIRRNERFRQFYDRLRDRGAPAKLAIVAVMRKLIVTLNAMLAKKQPWRASHNGDRPDVVTRPISTLAVIGSPACTAAVA